MTVLFSVNAAICGGKRWRNVRGVVFYDISHSFLYRNREHCFGLKTSSTVNTICMVCFRAGIIHMRVLFRLCEIINSHGRSKKNYTILTHLKRIKI